MSGRPIWVLGAFLVFGLAASATAQTLTEFTIEGEIDDVFGSFNDIMVGDDFVVTGSYDADQIGPFGLTPFDDPMFTFMLEVFENNTTNSLFGPLDASTDFEFVFGPLYTFDGNALDTIEYQSLIPDPSTRFEAFDLASAPAGTLEILSDSNDALILGSVTQFSVSPSAPEA